MKDVLIISHYVEFPFEMGNDRFCYLAEELVAQGMSVEIATSDFVHAKKAHRGLKKEDEKLVPYKITILHEPTYSKNVCLRRFYSHYILGRNLKKYLKTRKKPDVIYCAVPSLSVAKAAAEYANKQGVPFIVDIQDLWPEAFQMVFHVPVISNLIFKPFKAMANNIYKKADRIVAVSKTYVNRGLSVNKKVKSGLSVFLGTELRTFDAFAKTYEVIKPKDEIWLTYIGTLGHSYDLTIIIQALSKLKEQGISHLKLMILGDGPLKQKFEKEAYEAGINVEFLGRLAYEKMVGYLSQSDIALNPIVRGAASIINKVGDYAAAALPVINTQQCEEYRTLVEEYNMGINCDNLEEIIKAIRKLTEDVQLRKEMGQNNRRLAEDCFNKEVTYKKIVELIEKI